MPKKIQPRWGWQENNNARNQFLQMGRDGFERIATLIGIRDNDARERFWKDFSRALASYFFHAKNSPAPSKAEVKSALTEFQSRASAMKHALEYIDDISWRSLEGGVRRILYPEPFDPFSGEPNASDLAAHEPFLRAEDPFECSPLEIKMRETIEFLDLLERAVDAVSIEPTPKRRGPRPNVPLLTTIRMLAVAYGKHTDGSSYKSFYYDAESRKYGGPFFILVDESLKAYAPEERRSNNALGEAIRRAIGDRAVDDGVFDP